ncbi:peptidoglycan-binding domain-containing protein [Planosporangium mesophilum]|uniref:Peptidoglycan-binding protein n=1 Tax=Planosporangium mesophilum TaxID=689768 RepID=A0A8J3TAV7_9ACTN|nr:peptidoglycan-binding domain-containing protein [Planosporangium mesophilum]GII21479.1 peptidoglycan-binding protein [Planosporangium mesophilum]
MRRALRITAGVGGTALIAGTVAVAAVGLGGGDNRPAAVPELPPATAPVTKTTLAQTQRMTGTLGYGNPVPLSARGRGTLTWLPAAGATVQRGQAVYRADNVPVPLWYGTLPLYRALQPGATGADVREVEENLAALGYTGFTVDDRYTANTASAVRRWQHDQGAAENGTVDPAALVVAAGVIRVGTVRAGLGDPASGQVLTYTATTRVVTVPVDVAKQDLAKQGASATVTLPDSRSVAGTVASVGTVAAAGQQGAPATIEVTVTVADQAALGTLDQAPVDVTLVAAKAENVLTVPVSALVALAEGGYGVQVVIDSSSRYVPVKTGMFAGGRVEISGTGIAEGTAVGVPK